MIGHCCGGIAKDSRRRQHVRAWCFSGHLSDHCGGLMRRIIASVLFAIVLLTSGTVVTQYGTVSTAYAMDGAGP